MIQKNILVSSNDLESRINYDRSSYTLKFLKYVASFVSSNNNLNENEILFLVSELKAQSISIWNIVNSRLIHSSDSLVTLIEIEQIWKDVGNESKYKMISLPILLHFMEILNIIIPIKPSKMNDYHEIYGYKFNSKCIIQHDQFNWNKLPFIKTSPTDFHILALRRTIEKIHSEGEKMEEKSIE